MPRDFLRFCLYGLCIVLITFSACRTKKTLTTDLAVQLSRDSLISNLKSECTIQTFNCKSKIALESEYLSVKGNAYIKSITDSLVWIMVKKLNIEVGRALITKDSCIIINRFDRTYSQWPLDTLKQIYGIQPDISYLQHMIYGQITNLDTLETEVSVTEPNYVGSASISDVWHRFFASSTNLAIGQIRLKDKFGKEGTWTLDKFVDYGHDILIPEKRNYEITNNDNSPQSVELAISKLKVNEPLNISIRIPDNYKRIK